MSDSQNTVDYLKDLESENAALRQEIARLTACETLLEEARRVLEDNRRQIRGLQAREEGYHALEQQRRDQEVRCVAHVERCEQLQTLLAQAEQERDQAREQQAHTASCLIHLQRQLDEMRGILPHGHVGRCPNLMALQNSCDKDMQYWTARLAEIEQARDRLRAALEQIARLTQKNAGLVWIEEVAQQALSPNPVMESP